MSFQVRVLSTTHVQPDQSVAHGDHVIELSFFDTIFVTRMPIQRLFFYEALDLPPFPSLVRSLRSSLAATLAVFYPLAGKLAYVASSGDVIIDCSPAAVGPGVKFIEAEYSGGADEMGRLASDAEHNTEAFMRLVPELENGQLPAPLLAVQVTRPAGHDGGAVAVGVVIHHAVADGRSVWQFMRAWVAASREGSPTGPGLVPPMFDRAAIRHPQAVEIARKFLRTTAPALPLVRTCYSPDLTRQRRRTFLLSADQIRSLKQHISQSKIPEPPTTHVVVLSLVWTSIICAKSLNHADDAYIVFAADCRRRLRPPVDGGFFGNCVTAPLARATVGDLCGVDGLVHAASAVQEAVRRCLEEPLADVEGWLNLADMVSLETLVMMVSSNQFMAYETDFGWGRPSRVELVSLFRTELVALLGARDGGVQVSVALDRAVMEAFEANFSGAASTLQSSAC